jgi:hypothetical protein
MKKGKYIDYNIIMACLGKAPAKTSQAVETNYEAESANQLLPALRERLGLHGRFLTMATRYAHLPSIVHPQAA